MQGRQGQGYDSWDRSPGESLASVNGSGKQRAIPQRPPGMTRVKQPPQTPRVSRPQHQNRTSKSWRRRLLVLGLILLACGLLAWGIGYALANYFVGIGSSSAAANTATNFLLALKSTNYDQAYNDLDAKITISLTNDAFKQMSLADDHCYGQLTDFNEEAGSATTSADNNTQTGDWDITSYGDDLGPATPTCK